MKYNKLLLLTVFFSFTYSFNASIDTHTTPCKIIASGSYNIHTAIDALEKTRGSSIKPPIVEFIQYPDKSFPGYCLLLFNKEHRAEFEKNPMLSEQPHLIYLFP